MRELPSGTVTLLFTDIEGSTQRLHHLQDRYGEVLAAHRDILRRAVGAHDGVEVDNQGDAFFFVFPRATQAVTAAVTSQRALAAYPWPDEGTIRVRMGLHTGEPSRTAEGYFGLDLHRGARIMAAGHGGQVLLSEPAAVLVQAQLPDGVQLRDLGAHHLKDLLQPEHLFQLDIWGLPVDFPPPRTRDARPSLPSPLTSFVGRERESAEVTRLLGVTRLLTLTGPGGTGKTRLALAVAERVRSQYPDGVVFVDLSPITDPTLVISTIAQALGLRETEEQPVTQALTGYVREKRLLLIVDNFEQVVEAALVLRGLLAAAPGLTLLVTSRVVLRLFGEREYAVPPLPVPDDRSVAAGIDALRTVPSIALFLRQAQDARAGFALTADNAGAIAGICTRLDGLPLALVLAAARIRILSPAALLARLDQRLPLLTGGSRDLPERQRTLRATISWSYDLLTPADQMLFRRLSVFAGGCTPEAAKAIGLPDADQIYEVLDRLGALVLHSLLRQEDEPDAGSRFDMLETVREFAAEQLQEHGETEDARERHAWFYLALAEEAAVHLMSPTPSPWLTILQTEYDNLRAALRYALEHRAAHLALRLVGALGWFWQARGYIAEGRTWAEAAVALGSDDEHSLVWANALGILGQIAQWQGDRILADRCLEQSLSIWREGGDPRERAYILYWYAPALGRTNPAAALIACHESATLFRTVGDTWGLGLALSHIGLVAQRAGNDLQARSYYEESIQYLRPFGATWAIAVPLHNLGQIMQQQGEMATARLLFEESLPLHQALGENANTVSGRLSLALLLFMEGEPGRAASLAAEALRLIRKLGYYHRTADSLDICAGIAHAQGKPEIAARLFGAADAVRTATDEELPRTRLPDLFPPRRDAVRTISGEELHPSYARGRERAVAATRRALGDAAFAAAIAEGRALSLDAAITLALEQMAESEPVMTDRTAHMGPVT